MTRPLKEVLQEYEDRDDWEPAKYHQLIKALKQTLIMLRSDKAWSNEEIEKAIAFTLEDK